MDTIKKSSVKTENIYLYGVLIMLSVMFTIGDLVASGTQQLVVSTIFSTITLIVTFIGTNKAKAITIKKGVDTTVDFIKSNFNKSSVILSVLDVICSLIAVFSGIFVIALISRCTLALRIFIYINKYKTVAIAIFVFVFVYLFKRRGKISIGVKRKMAETENVEEKEVEVSTTKVSIPQWLTLLVGFLGVAYAIVAMFVPQIAIYGDQIISSLTGLGITAVTTVVGVFTKAKERTQEEIEKIAEKKVAAEEKIAEKKLAKDEKKAVALMNKLEAQKAKAEATEKEQAYLLELAKAVEARKVAEEQAKTEVVVEDKPTEEVIVDKPAE